MAGLEHHLWVWGCLEAAALSPAPSKAKMPSFTHHHISLQFRAQDFPLSFVHLLSPHTALSGLERSRAFVPGAISAVTAWECSVGAKHIHPAWPG